MNVGKEILCHCSKCKLKLSHMIESTYQGKILKVMCKTCKSVHIYREDTGKTAGPKKAATTRATSKSSIKKREFGNTKKVHTYEEAMDAASGQTSKPYAMSTLFEAGDVIDHPTFGMGMVEELLNGNIIVSFKNGKKTLVHNHKKA